MNPLLGGLLEVDPDRMWKFEKFFSEVTAVLACKRIHVFFVNRIQPITVFMDPQHTLVVYDFFIWNIEKGRFSQSRMFGKIVVFIMKWIRLTKNLADSECQEAGDE